MEGWLFYPTVCLTSSFTVKAGKRLLNDPDSCWCDVKLQWCMTSLSFEKPWQPIDDFLSYSKVYFIFKPQMCLSVYIIWLVYRYMSHSCVWKTDAFRYGFQYKILSIFECYIFLLRLVSCGDLWIIITEDFCNYQFGWTIALFSILLGKNQYYWLSH